MVMNKQDEKFLREQIRRVLHEENLICEESSSELHDVFVAPFKRVFDVFKVAAKDILTSTKFTWDMLVTFDPKKLMDQKANFEARKRKIKADYKKVMEPYDKLMGGDVGVAAMFLAPHVVIPMKAGQAALKGAKGMGGFLKDAGFGKPSEEEQEAIGTKEPKGVVASVVAQLGKLFFGESVVVAGGLLTEDAAEDAVTGALDDVGMLDDIEKGASELISGLEDDLKKLDVEFDPRWTAIRDIRGARNLDALAAALAAATEAGFELTDLNPDQIKSQVEADVENMLQDKEKFLGTLDKKQRASIEKMSENEVKEKLTELIFMNGTEGIRENTDKLGKQLQETLNNILVDVVPESDIKYLKKSEMGLEYLGIFNNFRKKFGMEEV